MRVIIVGLGVQGNKRRGFLAEKVVSTVDNSESSADYIDIKSVPIDSYDAAFLCVPDNEKFNLISYCIEIGKHVLVEKPLISQEISVIRELEERANTAGVQIYTAYNHRFEPHINEVKGMLDKNLIGKIYLIRMFYGNGTSQLVKASPWRDSNLGAIGDLAPHLFDLFAYWFSCGQINDLNIRSHSFETNSPDYAEIQGSINDIELKLEVTYCSWKNTFSCEIYGENGSIHVSSLCKWGPSSLVVRKRVFPSGPPIENSKTLISEDPTWILEHEYFFRRIGSRIPTSLERDIWIAEIMNELRKQIE